MSWLHGGCLAFGLPELAARGLPVLCAAGVCVVVGLTLALAQE